MRECGECKVCCKLPSIKELDKPAFKWCDNCNLSGKTEGCRIYEDRPDDCYKFACLWIENPHLPEKYRPDKCRVMLTCPDDLENSIIAWEVVPGAAEKKVMQPIYRFLISRGWRLWVRKDQENTELVYRMRPQLEHKSC